MAEESDKAISGIIDDIRHKLVEEAWFGQQTTDQYWESEIESPQNQELKNEGYDFSMSEMTDNLPSEADLDQSLEQDIDLER